MVNRRGREIPIAGFDPKGSLPEGLVPVARSSGQEALATSQSFERLASTLGAYADEAAAIEGAREGRTAGLEPGYRPKGETSIFGRAKEKAAIDTYTDTLEAQLRTRMQGLFESAVDVTDASGNVTGQVALKDNPAALKAALEGLQRDMRANDVFPEIEGHFNKSFSALATAYRNKAQANFDRNVDDGHRAALVRNLADVDTATKRAIATLDPDDPAIDQVVESGVRLKRQYYRRAAEMGAISEAIATTRAAGAGNEDWGAVVLARAAKLRTPGELEAFTTKFGEEFAGGKYQGRLDGDGFSDVKAKLAQLTRANSTASHAAAGALQRSVNDFVEREASGLSPPAGEWDALTAAAKNIPGGDQVIALGQGKRALAAQLNAASPEGADVLMKSLRETMRDAGGVDTHRAELLKFGDKMAADLRKGLRTDQLGSAQRRGVIGEIAPLDLAGFATSADVAAPDILAQQITNRAVQARAVATELGRAPQFLRPDEKVAMKTIMDAGGDRALGLAGAIVRGGNVDAPMMLKEIGGDAPLLAQAGNIIAEGGSLQAARDALEAARLRHEKGAKITSMDAPTADKSARDILGAAYFLAPEDGARVRATADAIAATRLTAAGVDPKSADAKTIYERALLEASGALFVDGAQYGGVAVYNKRDWFGAARRVVVPAGVRADGFRDVIRSLREEDFASLAVPPQGSDGKPYRARDFADAVPVAVRGGYRFAKGDPASDDPKYIRGADGRPFVLPFDQLLPELRKRMPGAFLGGH